MPCWNGGVRERKSSKQFYGSWFRHLGSGWYCSKIKGKIGTKADWVGGRREVLRISVGYICSLEVSDGFVGGEAGGWPSVTR